MGRRVLVTGASGFIGRRCLPLLSARGFQVHAVSRGDRPLEGSGAIWHRADLLEETAARSLLESVQPSHLLHLAWVSEHGRFWTAPENVGWLCASLRLMQLFAATGGERTVSAGSCAEYDWGHWVCREDDTPLRPATLYGKCKHALQLVSSDYLAQLGVSAAWGRVFFAYGPGEQPGRLVASVIRALLRGEPALCSHGRQIRDFLYVEDVANAFVELLDCDVRGAVNVASGTAVPIETLVMTIGRRLDRPELVRLGALAARVGDPDRLTASTTRLRSEVGVTPQWSLERGLDETISFWRRELEEGAQA